MRIAISVPGEISINDDAELRLASAGKLLVLACAARGLAAGTLDPDEVVEVRDADYVNGSGLLGVLSERRWTIGDLAVLVASVSDNTATNALLRHLGLDRITDESARLGLIRTRVLDRVREPRLPSDPPHFAVGTAGELARFAALLDGEEEWTRTMLGWMAHNTDRCLVPALVPHDPESRKIPDKTAPGTIWVANKTGIDDGVRTDVGVLVGVRRIGYAVLANGPTVGGDDHELVRRVREAGVEIAALAGVPRPHVA
ncbi:serine hydrolase [Spongiactinospora rosea]|uniref:serine hydrolase n=1 Tax=Spongiactinospora rosea TaxID=2248750 RepID=UPI001CEC02F7|nr:serine hydrolase [Spongiactinospora rosea]